jgi:hypothetical protein
MDKYAKEQDELEKRIAEIKKRLEETTATNIQIEKFIALIKKYNEPQELTKEMARELIDKIVVHQAVGKKPNRQQQVDIYYNFIGAFAPALTAEEIELAKQAAEQEAAEKQERKAMRSKERDKARRAQKKAERWEANEGHKYPKRTCEWCGKEFWPNSTQQRFCTKDCTKEYQQDKKDKQRYAEKGDHIFRQKECKICGKLFWPVNGQEVMCSEKCKAENRRKLQLAYYHRKQAAMTTNNSTTKTEEHYNGEIHHGRADRVTV